MNKPNQGSAKVAACVCVCVALLTVLSVRRHARPESVEQLWAGVAHIVDLDEIVVFEDPSARGAWRAQHSVGGFWSSLASATCRREWRSVEDTSGDGYRVVHTHA